MNGAIGLLVLSGIVLLIWLGNFQAGLGVSAPVIQGWLALLIALMMLGVGFVLFKQAMRRSDENAQQQLKMAEWYAQHEREIEAERVQEASFQAYLDRMTDLLLDKGLRRSRPGAEVRDIARARTLTVLRGLDGIHKGILLRFLHETELLKNQPTVDLKEADLSGAYLKNASLENIGLTGADLSAADLNGANLSKADLVGARLIVADLSGADLHRANLSKANLTEARLVVSSLTEADLTCADLHGANLEGADLIGANMHQADLHDAILIVSNMIEANLTGAILVGTNLEAAELIEADLRGADLSRAQLKGASLRGAKYDKQTKWPKGINPAEFDAVLVK